jgi:hypothetical protein
VSRQLKARTQALLWSVFRDKEALYQRMGLMMLPRRKRASTILSQGLLYLTLTSALVAKKRQYKKLVTKCSAAPCCKLRRIIRKTFLNKKKKNLLRGL